MPGACLPVKVICMGDLDLDIPTSMLEQRCVTDDHGFTQKASQSSCNRLHVRGKKTVNARVVSIKLARRKTPVRQDRLMAQHDA